MQPSQQEDHIQRVLAPVEPNPGPPEAGPAPGHHSDVTLSPRLSAQELAQLMARLAQELHGQQGTEAVLRMIVAEAVNAVPGAEAGAVTEVLGRGQNIDVSYATDEWVVALDAAQYQSEEGPGLKESYEEPTVRVEDFAEEPRWPTFASRAHQLNARSLLSLRLYLQGQDLAVLNLYSSRTAAFDDESEQVGQVFAAHAAIALAGARSQEQWRAAVGSRDIIGQAKGILMERFKISADQAFQVLAKASSESDIKVRDVAEMFAGSGRSTVPAPGADGD